MASSHRVGGTVAVRVAALYDIHGNLPALEAVLDDVRKEQVDAVVIGGDVLPGPMPRETIACLLNLGARVRFIHGNGDREVLAYIRGEGSVGLPEQAREALRWTAQQLGAEDERLLASWPSTLTMTIPGLGDVLFCHATPQNDTDIFTRLTPDAAVLPILRGLNERLVVCGHTHMQFERMIGGTRIVNAGSVGMPFGNPGADWLLLGPDVQLRHTSYDLARSAERIRRTTFPRAEEFAAHNILQPPAETDMLATFTRQGLK